MMNRIRFVHFVYVAAAALAAVQAFAQGETGRIEGRVIRTDDSPVSGVSVVVNELSLTEITDANGLFAFPSVPAGAYTVSFVLGTNLVTSEVTVAGGQPALIEQRVDWTAGFAETLTVLAHRAEWSASWRLPRR
jgi:hypothetical protein